MNFLVNYNEDIYKLWKNCRGNLKLTSPDIQKDIVKAVATVTTQVILNDLGDDLFAILIDKSRDISVKEQLVVVIRYVNNEGKVIGRFLGVVHVSNISALTLKSGIIDCIRYLLAQGLAFHCNVESISSKNKGNFLELMNFLVNHNENIYKVCKNCRGNLKLTSPDIQKDIVKDAATITTQVILDDLGDDLFAILIDVSRDISVKEQMIMVIHYVNNEGKVIERFLSVIHVSNTSALTLK
ncbi:hypothetical protein KIW84_045454 [Lathyrus oleraceus]|uniref:DUF4371 domain-containing protein n=1 Tax=Pisum sativum TaxID=3888 RepID=A0A9D4XKR2_PEA|nr:hypothetical protein KIW84_045454 [Pisum sativum]